MVTHYVNECLHKEVKKYRCVFHHTKGWNERDRGKKAIKATSHVWSHERQWAFTHTERDREKMSRLLESDRFIRFVNGTGLSAVTVRRWLHGEQHSWVIVFIIKLRRSYCYHSSLTSHSLLPLLLPLFVCLSLPVTSIYCADEEFLTPSDHRSNNLSQNKNNCEDEWTKLEKKEKTSRTTYERKGKKSKEKEDILRVHLEKKKKNLRK